MQTKLHRWAGEGSTRRCDDLFNLVYDPAFLAVAWERVRSNTGARTPGIDGCTARWIHRQGDGPKLLRDVREQLKQRTFEPVPVREKTIPKANGKLRRLGIPTVADRVVQAALKLVLEPIFEADFEPCSYGFRPRRRAHDAIAEIHHYGSHRYHWVLEADIEACFDTIDHTALMGRVRRRVSDKRVLNLVKAFLKAGLLTELGHEEETRAGTPQGGILSPLLANIALSALDEHFMTQWRQTMNTQSRREVRRRKGLGTWRLIRYADDFVIIVHGTRDIADSLRDQVAAVIAPLGLRLSEAKTQVVHLDEGFDFLGHHIQRRRKRGSHKQFVYTTPSRKAVKTITTRVKVLTADRTVNQDLATLLRRLNATLRGWANYFRYASAKRRFSEIDYYVWSKVVRWLRRKHTRISWTALRRRYMNGWKLAADGITFTGAASVRVTRYRYRGTVIPTPWTASVPTEIAHTA
jgi:RNA-directed DNA polymerase